MFAQSLKLLIADAKEFEKPASTKKWKRDGGEQRGRFWPIWNGLMALTNGIRVHVRCVDCIPRHRL